MALCNSMNHRQTKIPWLGQINICKDLCNDRNGPEMTIARDAKTAGVPTPGKQFTNLGSVGMMV